MRNRRLLNRPPTYTPHPPGVTTGVLWEQLNTLHPTCKEQSRAFSPALAAHGELVLRWFVRDDGSPLSGWGAPHFRRRKRGYSLSLVEVPSLLPLSESPAHPPSAGGNLRAAKGFLEKGDFGDSHPTPGTGCRPCRPHPLPGRAGTMRPSAHGLLSHRL